MSTFDLTFKIYNLLKQKNYTIIQLHDRLTADNIEISIRTLYRKVIAIQEALNETNEYLDIEIDDRNVNNYSVKTNNQNFNLKNSEWIDYINSVVVFKNNFNIKRDSLINNLFLNSVHKDAPLKTLLISLLNENLDFYQTTKFGELILTKKLKRNLFKFIYYYTKNCIVTISKFSDSVKNNKNIPSVLEFLLPINIIYHRGSYNLLFYSEGINKTYSLELDMIDSITYVSANKNFKLKDEILRDINDNSFGYHPSFDNKIHEIKLLFPTNPGEHVMNRYWHKSQKFKKLSDGTIELCLTCKIDIELLGWIGLWLDNVKIISPPILKDFFIEKINNITSIYDKNSLPNNNG